MSKGTAIIKISIGIFTINSPFNENMTTIVNNNAIKVIGEIVGMNFLVYHSSPFAFTNINLLNKPAKKGMLGKGKKKSERLITICNKLGAESYINLKGGRELYDKSYLSVKIIFKAGTKWQRCIGT